MFVRHAKILFFFRVENHDVGIRADGDCAFFREKTEHFRGGGRSQFDKAIQRNSVFDHSAVVKPDPDNF